LRAKKEKESGVLDDIKFEISPGNSPFERFLLWCPLILTQEIHHLKWQSSTKTSRKNTIF